VGLDDIDTDVLRELVAASAARSTG